MHGRDFESYKNVNAEMKSSVEELENEMKEISQEVEQKIRR